MLAAGFVAVLLASACSDSSGDSSPAPTVPATTGATTPSTTGVDAGTAPAGAAAAGAVIAGMLAQADFTAGTSSAVDACPVDFAAVLAAAPAGSGIAALDAAATQRYQDALKAARSDYAIVECAIEGDGGLAGLSLSTSPGAAAYEATMKTFFERYDVTFNDGRPYRGGTLFVYCGALNASTPEGWGPFCDADWVGDDLVVGLFAGPDTATDAELVGWLDATLDDIVGALAA
jgi:hypothetical protein